MRNVFRNSFLFSSILAVSFFPITGCTTNQDRELPTSGTAVVAYAEDLAPVMNKEKVEFERLYSKAHLTMIVTSSSEAVALLLNDSVHAIAIGRDLTDDEWSIVNKYKLEVDTHKVAYDGMAILVNEKNTVQRLTNRQLQAILSGTAKTWKEAGENGDNSRILLAFGGKNSSLRNYCTDRFIPGIPLAESVAPCTSTQQAIEFVRTHSSAIGFVTTSWVKIDSLPAGTKLLDIGDPKFQRDSTVTKLEYFSPHPYYLYRNYYPMRRTIFMVTKNAGSGVGMGFVAFVAGVEGQRIITSSGLLPATMPVHFTSSTSP